MNKIEFKASMAALAGDYWEQEQDMINDMKSDGEIPPLALEARSLPSLMLDFCEMLKVIYEDDARAENAEAIKANARLANQYR